MTLRPASRLQRREAGPSAPRPFRPPQLPWDVLRSRHSWEPSWPPGSGGRSSAHQILEGRHLEPHNRAVPGPRSDWWLSGRGRKKSISARSEPDGQIAAARNADLPTMHRSGRSAPDKFRKACRMAKRRREEEFVGVLEFEGRTSQDPEVMNWLAEHKAQNGGRIRLSRGSTGIRVAFSKAADMALWQARSAQGGKGKRSPRS